QEYPSHSMSATPKLGRLWFQVLVEPSKDGLMPQPAVLRLQHPVPYVRKIEQFGGHAAALERGEDLERLAVRHTIVQVALDNQHRRIQLLDEVRRRRLFVEVRVFPRHAFEFPLREPEF